MGWGKEANRPELEEEGEPQLKGDRGGRGPEQKGRSQITGCGQSLLVSDLFHSEMAGRK